MSASKHQMIDRDVHCFCVYASGDPLRGCFHASNLALAEDVRCRRRYDTIFDNARKIVIGDYGAIGGLIMGGAAMIGGQDVR